MLNLDFKYFQTTKPHDNCKDKSNSFMNAQLFQFFHYVIAIK